MKIYLGALSGIQYLGENEKEFSRSPFNPKPLVKNGDIVVLENIHAHNLSKLLPTEWKKLDKTFIEVDSDLSLLEKIAELESYIAELEDVVAQHDLKQISDDERIENILNGLSSGTLMLETLSDYDRALYDNHINNTSSPDNENILNNGIPLINAGEALNNVSILKPIEDFKTKAELESYALENFGFELDKRLTLSKMYQTLEDILADKEAK